MKIKHVFLELFDHQFDSVDCQDELMQFYEFVGVIGGNYEINDSESEQLFTDIVLTPELNGVEKFAYLSALDVAVQNHHPRGLAAEIITEIHALQGAMVLKGVV